MRYMLLAAAGMACAAYAESLVKDGSFDLSKDSPSAEYSPRKDCRFELFTEDLSWNKCGKLSISKSQKDKKGNILHTAWLEIGRDGERPGFAVEPDTFYDFSLEVKGVAPAYVRAAELSGGAKPVRRRLPLDVSVQPGAEWRRVMGRFRTGPDAARALLCVEIWGRETLKVGDYVLIDNVKVERAAVNDALFKSGRKVAVAAISPVAEMACPFFPEALASAPQEIAFRAAVNEQKPLPVAVANLTDKMAQYRVVLETEPEGFTASRTVPDDGDFGLKGFPASKITVREALRFKDTDGEPVSLRLDPLPRIDEASVITVPAREAGLVWFDFDTHGVEPGEYRGRLRVIPLGEQAKYEMDAKKRAYVRKASSEAFVPVTLTVDPIFLPVEPVRPAHLCCNAESEESFNLQADIGARIFFMNVWWFNAANAENPDNMVAQSVRRHRAWAKKRGIDIKFFVKYSAFSYSQRAFNSKGKPELKWKVWEETVRTIKRTMNAAGVDDKDYLVETWDEPAGKDLPDMIEAHRRAKAIAPTMQLYMPLCVRDILDHDFLTPMNDMTDLWIFLDHPSYFSGPLYERIEKVHKAGKPVFHYLCSVVPTQSLSGYFRRHCWRGEYYGLDGDFLYQFLDSARTGRGRLSLKTRTNGEIAYRLGETTVPSIRYMAYREGITDIKYLAALRALAGKDAEVAVFLTNAAARVIVEDPTSRELPAVMREEARRLLLAKSPVPPDTLVPVRPGGVDGQAFWNGNADWFLYPPSFDFKEVPGAVRYRFTVLDDQHLAHKFEADAPTASLAPVWGGIPPGLTSVFCEGLDAERNVAGSAGSRTRFWRQAPFRKGAYPAAKRPYAEAAALVYDYLYERPSTRYLAKTGEMDFTYSRNAYPAKMGSAIISAMAGYAKRRPERAKEAIDIAVKQAEWLLAHSQPKGAPLEFFPPTYAGDKLTAKRYAGECMLIYPVQAADAYLDLHAAVKDAKWLDAALRIGETFLKLQGKDGTWHLKMREKDGEPIGRNRCFPMHQILFFERLYGLTKSSKWRKAADRAFVFVESGPLKTWNWEGQFEDVEPTERFVNLTKHDACSTAMYLLKRFPGDAARIRQARELLRFSEDQFICWELPCRADGKGPRYTGKERKWVQNDYLDWTVPGVTEQYRCYHPIDSSAAKLIFTYLAMYNATGDAGDLAKARALGDTIVNVQDDDGRVPTHWNKSRFHDRDYDWVNCMHASAKALDSLADAVRKAKAAKGGK